MISDLIKNNYDMRKDPYIAFSENRKILISLEAYGEGIFGKNVNIKETFNNVKKGVGDAAKGTAASASFQWEKFRTIFKAIIDQIKKMISNLWHSLMGVEKGLERLVNDINNAIAKRHPGGKFPEKMTIISPDGLNVIGLDVTKEGSRASIARGYLETVTKNSLLEGIHFGDEASEKRAIEILVERISGQKRPFDSITPEQFKQDIRDNLYIFNLDELNKKLQAQSKNANTQKAKTFWKSFLGMKQGASVDSKAMKEAMTDIEGGSAAGVLTDSLNIIKNSAEVFVNLKAVDFMRNEDQHLTQLGNDIDKMLENKIREDQQKAKEQNAAQNTASTNTNNTSQQQQQSSNQQQNTTNNSTQQQPNSQSYFDNKLFNEIVKAGFAEAGGFAANVFNNQKGKPDGPANTPKPNYPKEAYPTSAEMSKDHQLIDIFLVEYSKALNDTIQNVSYLYTALINAGKTCLAMYYKVTQ